MNDKNRGLIQILIKPAIRFVIGLVILLIVRYIVAALPMVKDAQIVRQSFTLEATAIAHAIIDTIIIVILINFGREIGNALRRTVKRFPETGTVVNLVIVLIAISIAYSAYNDLARIFIRGRISWLYPVIFIAIAIYPLYLLIMTFYRSIDRLTDVTVDKIETAMKAESVCPSCGAKVSATAQFCRTCGQKIIRPEEKEEAEEAEDESKCPECGAIVGKNAKFCEECGSKITT